MMQQVKRLAENMNNSCILVTGATGLIGSTFIKMLKSISDVNIEIYILVRNISKAKTIFENLNLKYLQSDILDLSICENYRFDYIVHCACETDSKMFIEKPVETIQVSLLGTMNILELAKKMQSKSVVCLSSMEVYGKTSNDGMTLLEKDLGILDTSEIRNSYPQSKRMVENMCISYWNEYGIPVKVLRLAQTFGPGIMYQDKRVFAEFSRCVIENKNIVLNTKGKSERMYLYSEDAVSAILFLLIMGDNGEIYNAANEETYCSVYEMANMVVSEVAHGKISLEVKENEQESKKYMSEHHLKLDTRKLRQLGWKAEVGLIDMYKKLITDLESKRG